MRKFLKLLLIGYFFVSFTGCISVQMLKDNLVREAKCKEGITQVYNYPYSDVYKAIMDVLEKKLHFDIDRRYTNDYSIVSVHFSAFTVIYAYVFNLRKIDEKSTEVTLRSRGSLNSVSSKDILDKYLLRELKHLRQNSQGK